MNDSVSYSVFFDQQGSVLSILFHVVSADFSADFTMLSESDASAGILKGAYDVGFVPDAFLALDKDGDLANKQAIVDAAISKYKQMRAEKEAMKPQPGPTVKEIERLDRQAKISLSINPADFGAAIAADQAVIL